MRCGEVAVIDEVTGGINHHERSAASPAQHGHGKNIVIYPSVIYISVGFSYKTVDSHMTPVKAM